MGQIGWISCVQYPKETRLETEGKRLLDLQGHCSPKKADPSEAVPYREEQGAEEREGEGGEFILSSCSVSLLIPDFKSAACVSVLVWGDIRPQLTSTISAKLKGRREFVLLLSFLAGFRQMVTSPILPVLVPGSQRTICSCCYWGMSALEELPRATTNDWKWTFCFWLCSIRTSLLDAEELTEILTRGIWMLLSGLLERLTFPINIKKKKRWFILVVVQIQALQK